MNVLLGGRVRLSPALCTRAVGPIIENRVNNGGVLSYIAVNRGLGSNPFEAMTSIIVVVGFVFGLNWLRRLGRAGSPGPKQSRGRIVEER